MIEPMGAWSKIVCADIVSSLFACAWKQSRRRLGRRRWIVRKKRRVPLFGRLPECLGLFVREVIPHAGGVLFSLVGVCRRLARRQPLRKLLGVRREERCGMDEVAFLEMLNERGARVLHALARQNGGVLARGLDRCARQA